METPTKGDDGRTRLFASVLAVVVTMILETAAQAQSFPGPTLGSGDIYVNPIATEFFGPDPGVCSFTGAMNQATTGRLDRGCANDGQFYGGGPGDGPRLTWTPPWFSISSRPSKSLTLPFR
jgi:hypothetical protein